MTGRGLNAMASVLALTLIAGCGGSGSQSPPAKEATSKAGETTPQTTPATPKAKENTPQAGALAPKAKEQATHAQETTPKAKEAAPKAPEHIPTIGITVSSPAFVKRKSISTRYTCDGADVSPPLRWSHIPKGTAELLLVIGDLLPAPGGGEQISWAVTGLQPSLRGLPAGKLPPSAIVGRNSFGQNRYSICPPKDGSVHEYLVALYALTHTVPAAPGFEAHPLVQTAQRIAEYKGLAGFSYERK